MPRTSIELPPIHLNDVTSEPFSSMNLNRQREILPSILANSPPGRSSTLPPLQRSLNPNRPRKQSVTKRGREAHHKKQKSRGSGGSGGEWLRRLQNNDDRLRPGDHNRKALSAEPMPDYGKRWEDLIDAADQAASMAGDVDEERTPVSSDSDRSPVRHMEAANRLDIGATVASFGSQSIPPPILSCTSPFSAGKLPSLASPAGTHPAIVQPRTPRSGAFPFGRERRERRELPY